MTAGTAIPPYSPSHLVRHPTLFAIPLCLAIVAVWYAICTSRIGDDACFLVLRKKCGDSMLEKIHRQLQRVRAERVRVSLDDQFDPQSGTLVKIELDQAYWHMIPEELYQLLEELPDDAGSAEVQRIIQHKASHIWHAEAPHESRDSSPPDSAGHAPLQSDPQSLTRTPRE